MILLPEMAFPEMAVARRANVGRLSDSAGVSYFSDCHGRTRMVGDFERRFERF